MVKRFLGGMVLALLFVVSASAQVIPPQPSIARKGGTVKIDNNGKITIAPKSTASTEVDGAISFSSATVTGLTAGEIPSLDAGKITTGIFGVARLGSGSGSSSNFLRGDGTWSNAFAGGATIGANGTSLTRVIHGTCTLSSGACTVSNANVTTSSRILLTGQDNNVTGALRVSARSAGVSFTVTSSQAGDSGVVAYEILEP